MPEYNDCYIIPQFSRIKSRKDVYTSSILDPKHSKTQIPVPVISANMDTVTDGNFALKIAKAGGIGAIHRFLSIDENIVELKKTQGKPCLVSVGVSKEAKERASVLYAHGARHFIIDVAHGHHYLMRDMISFFKKFLPEAYIMAGNVATEEGAADLVKWGAHGVKCGIAGGSVCTTKNTTGVSVPQVIALQNVVRAVKSIDPEIVVVADGGIREIGDIAKALGFGADFVMCGRLFAQCVETPHPGIYRGMSSLDAMTTYKKTTELPTPEGKTIAVDTNQHVEEIVSLIAGGLQSAFSYSNSSCLSEFHKKCKFGFK